MEVFESIRQSVREFTILGTDVPYFSLSGVDGFPMGRDTRLSILLSDDWSEEWRVFIVAIEIARQFLKELTQEPRNDLTLRKSEVVPCDKRGAIAASHLLIPPRFFQGVHLGAARDESQTTFQLSQRLGIPRDAAAIYMMSLRYQGKLRVSLRAIRKDLEYSEFGNLKREVREVQPYLEEVHQRLRSLTGRPYFCNVRACASFSEATRTGEVRVIGADMAERAVTKLQESQTPLPQGSDLWFGSGGPNACAECPLGQLKYNG